MDRILDFERGKDKIILDGGTFTEVGKTIKFSTVGDLSAAKTSKSQLTYIQATGRLYYNANGNKSGFGGGSQFADLNDGQALSVKDFTVFG